MKNYYYAVSIKEDGKNITYTLKVSENENLLSAFCLKGVTVVNACSTKKEADALVAFWNDCYKKNNTYMF